MKKHPRHSEGKWLIMLGLKPTADKIFVSPAKLPPIEKRCDILIKKSKPFPISKGHIRQINQTF